MSLRIFTTILLTSVLSTSTVHAQRRINMNFNGQLIAAATEIKEKIAADPELMGRKLRIAKFSGPFLPDSSFETKFEDGFRELLKDHLDESSRFFISGEYDFLPGALEENAKLKVIQLVIKITNPQRRELHRITREINNTADIARITGSTVAPPDSKDVKERNKAVEKAFDKPQFSILGESQITTVGNNDYTVEIRKHIGGTGPAIPVIPQNQNGMAFVDLGVRDTFEIVVYTYETKCDATAVISIDGLDVANEFCEDKKNYDGYIINRARGTTPGKHLVPGWLKTTKRSTGNVYKFVINELGQGAATERKSRNSLGMINVQFYESVPPGQKLPARSFGEVGRGELMNVKYKTVQMTKRDTPISNISIRYNNRPEK